MDPDTEELNLLSRVAKADKDRSSVQETPMTSEERVSQVIGVTIEFQKNAAPFPPLTTENGRSKEMSSSITWKRQKMKTGKSTGKNFVG